MSSLKGVTLRIDRHRWSSSHSDRKHYNLLVRHDRGNGTTSLRVLRHRLQADNSYRQRMLDHSGHSTLHARWDQECSLHFLPVESYSTGSTQVHHKLHNARSSRPLAQTHLQGDLLSPQRRSPPVWRRGSNLIAIPRRHTLVHDRCVPWSHHRIRPHDSRLL